MSHSTRSWLWGDMHPYCLTVYPPIKPLPDPATPVLRKALDELQNPTEAETPLGGPKENPT